MSVSVRPGGPSERREDLPNIRAPIRPPGAALVQSGAGVTAALTVVFVNTGGFFLLFNVKRLGFLVSIPLLSPSCPFGPSVVFLGTE